MASTISQGLLLTVPLAPLAGALIAGLAGKAVGRRGAHWASPSWACSSPSSARRWC
jgi:NADH-quinone oxidoreductase subunit L